MAFGSAKAWNWGPLPEPWMPTRASALAQILLTMPIFRHRIHGQPKDWVTTSLSSAACTFRCVLTVSSVWECFWCAATQRSRMTSPESYGVYTPCTRSCVGCGFELVQLESLNSRICIAKGSQLQGPPRPSLLSSPLLKHRGSVTGRSCRTG